MTPSSPFRSKIYVRFIIVVVFECTIIFFLFRYFFALLETEQENNNSHLIAPRFISATAMKRTTNETFKRRRQTYDFLQRCLDEYTLQGAWDGDYLAGPLSHCRLWRSTE